MQLLLLWTEKSFIRFKNLTQKILENSKRLKLSRQHWIFVRIIKKVLHSIKNFSRKNERKHKKQNSRKYVKKKRDF